MRQDKRYLSAFGRGKCKEKSTLILYLSLSLPALGPFASTGGEPARYPAGGATRASSAMPICPVAMLASAATMIAAAVPGETTPP